MLKDNDFSLAILMHVEIMFLELKKNYKEVILQLNILHENAKIH